VAHPIVPAVYAIEIDISSICITRARWYIQLLLLLQSTSPACDTPPQYVNIIYIHMYKYIYIYMYVQIHIYLHISMCIFIRTYVCIGMHICVHVNMYICMYSYMIVVFGDVCMHVCMCSCVYTCIYLWKLTCRVTKTEQTLTELTHIRASSLNAETATPFAWHFPPPAQSPSSSDPSLCAARARRCDPGRLSRTLGAGCEVAR